MSLCYISLAQEFLFDQIVSEPMRGENILDLCFTSHPGHIFNCNVAPGLSDHNAVIFELVNSLDAHIKCKKKICFYKKANWSFICERLNTMFQMSTSIQYQQ